MYDLLKEHKMWEDRIKEARKRGHFTEDDVDCAAGWACCAVGENAMKFGHQMGAGGPNDLFYSKQLWKNFNYVAIDLFTTLGCQFSKAVATNNFDLAQELLDEINELSDDVIPILYSEVKI